MLYDFHDNYSFKISSTAPYLLDLPMPVFTSLCVSLDSGAIHNWKHHLHDYTMTDVLQLSIIEQRVSFVLNLDRLVLHGAAIYSIDIL